MRPNISHLSKLFLAVFLTASLAACGGGGGDSSSSSVPFPSVLTGMPTYSVNLAKLSTVGSFVSTMFNGLNNPTVDQLYQQFMAGKKVQATSQGCTVIADPIGQYVGPYVSIKCATETYDIQYTKDLQAYELKAYIYVAGKLTNTTYIYIPTTNANQADYNVQQVTANGNISNTYHYYWNGRSYDYLGVTNP